MSDTPKTSGADSGIEDVERHLREERPQPTGEQLERMRRISLSSSRGRRRRAPLRGFQPGLARLAMVALLSGALLVAATSTSLAVSGISGDGSAGKAQYCGGGREDALGDAERGGVDRSDETGSPCDSERQLASAGDDSLPFTGLAMVPLLVLGCILLVSGFLLRHRGRAAGTVS